MEPLGEYLKQVRESKKLLIDKVVEDTHIIKKFVVAIENDDFSAFPGEAYLKGFLRTYSDYLGINADEVIRRFEKIKLAEAPSPIEQLIPKPSVNYKKIVKISMVSLAGVVGVIFVIFLVGSIAHGILNSTASHSDANKKTVKTGKGVTLDKDEDVFNLKNGDSVNVSIDDKKYVVKIGSLDPTVVVKYSEQGSGTEREQVILKSYTQFIDFNEDQQNDVEIVLNYWDQNSANIKLRKVSPGIMNTTVIDNKFLVGETIQTVYEGVAKEDIGITLRFSEDTYVKYRADKTAEQEGKFFKNNILNIKAKDQVIIWMVNSHAVSMDFDKYGKKFSSDETGKVDVKLVTWTKNGDNYSLQMSSLK